jgi:HEAT repeat protein
MSSDDLTPLFVALRDEQHEVRWPATLTLLHLDDPAAVPQLLDALANSDRRVRGFIVTKLGQLELGQLGDRRAVPALLTLLHTEETDGHSNIRAQAAEALGRLADPQAVEPLIAALADTDMDTHLEVLVALGRLMDRRAVEPLIAATRKFHNPHGATILGNLGDLRAVEPLLAELESLRQWHANRGRSIGPFDGMSLYYYYLIRALGKLRDPRAVPLLEWVREHEHVPVLKGKNLADVAAKALQRIAEQRGIGADGSARGDRPADPQCG